MKIALIASKESGKTSYIASLYGELQKKFRHFPEEHKIKTTFSDMKQKSSLENKYMNLLEGKKIQGTDSLDFYNVNIRHYDMSSEINMNLVDFPGENIRNQGESVKDIQDTLDELSYCDAFIVLIDASYADNEIDLFELKTQINNIINLLSIVKEQKKNTEYSLNGIPFIFAISKFDKISSINNLEISRDKAERVFNNIQIAFSQFFNSNECISVLTKISVGDNIDDGGKYNPINIITPFYLALGIGSLSGARFGHDVRDALYKEAENARQKRRNAKDTHEIDEYIYDRRRSKNIIHRFYKYIDTGKRTHDLKNEMKKSERKHDSSVKHHEYKLEQISKTQQNITSLRNIGLAALNHIDRNLFNKEPIMIKVVQNGEIKKLKDNINSETDDILEPFL